LRGKSFRYYWRVQRHWIGGCESVFEAGGKVVIGGRSDKVIQETVESLKKDGFDGAKIDGGCTIDLTDLQSGKAFATYVKGIVLICNAGVMATTRGHEVGIRAAVRDQCDRAFFLLAKLLLDVTSRQVWLSSSEYLRVS
jgi:hypothetical protein